MDNNNIIKINNKKMIMNHINMTINQEVNLHQFFFKL